MNKANSKLSVKKEPVRIKRRYTSLNATRPKDLSIREAQEQVNRYIRSKTTETSRIRDPFLTLGFFFEEAGELARAIINLESEIQEFQRTGFRKSREAKIEMVRDALGDLFYDLCWIASTHNINLQIAFQQAMTSIRTRYPAKGDKLKHLHEGVQEPLNGH